ncbi:27467_t:CDS:2, partial [Gigaspora margarita]
NVNDVVEAMFGIFPEENVIIIYMYEESKENNQVYSGDGLFSELKRCSIGFLAKAKNET